MTSLASRLGLLLAASSEFLFAGRGAVLPLMLTACLLVAVSPTDAQESADQSTAPVADSTTPDTTAIADPSLDSDELTLKLLPLSQEEMAVAASAWFELLKDKTSEIVDAKIAVRTAEGDAAEDLQEQIARLTEERKPLAEKYTLVLDAFEDKGGDPDTITVYRKYLKAIAVGELRATDPATLLNHFFDWLGARDGGIAVLTKLAIAAG